MTVEHDEKEGRFFVRIDGDEADLMYTRIGPHLIDLQHTSDDRGVELCSGDARHREQPAVRVVQARNFELDHAPDRRRDVALELGRQLRELPTAVHRLDDAAVTEVPHQVGATVFITRATGVSDWSRSASRASSHGRYALEPA